MASSVKQISFLLVCLYALQAVAGETSEVPCVCVWDFQCINGTLNQSGIGIIEPRSSFKSNCKELGFTCCPYGGSNKTETSTDEDSTTPPSTDNETVHKGVEAPKRSDQPLYDPTLSGFDSGRSFGVPVPIRPISNGSIASPPAPSGYVPSGSIPSQSVLSGSVPSGSVKDGSFPSNPLQRGSPRSVSVLSTTSSSAFLPTSFSSKPFPSGSFPNNAFFTIHFPSGSGPFPAAPFPNYAPYPSSFYFSAPYPTSSHPKQPVKLIPETPGPEASDPVAPKEPNRNTANTFVVIEDTRKPKANAFFVPKPGCGVKRAELKQRISLTWLDESIGSFAEFPWMLAVFSYQNSTSWKFECGASLIHKEVALTSAHCVSNFPVTSLRIRAGEWNIKTTEEPESHQDRKARRVEIHPFYRHFGLSHDIALIFLNTPFNTTRNVDTICLPSADSLFHNRRCTVTGWGEDSNNLEVMHHDILHKAEVSVIPRDECERRLSVTRGQPTGVHYSFLCAGGEIGRNACKGNEGGPLICPTDEENRWVQAGVVSSDCGRTNEPAFYTDVSLHFDWIDRYLREIEHIRAYRHGSSNIPYIYQPYVITHFTIPYVYQPAWLLY